MGSIFRKGSQQTGQATGIDQAVAQRSADLWNVFGPQLTAQASTGQLPVPFEQILGQGAQELGTEGSAARQSILDTGTRGGALQSALTNVQSNRMQALDKLRAQIGGSLYGTGVQAAVNPAGALGAAGQLGTLGAGRIAENQRAQQGIGQIGGKLLSKGMG